MFRKIVGAVLTIALVIVLAPRVHAQDAVSLRLELAQGEVLPYAFSETMRFSLEIGAQRRTMDARAEGREVHRVMETGTDGSMLVEIAYEDLTFTANGTTTHPIWPSVQVRVAADGTVVSETACGCGLASYPVVLPAGPVGVGASWTRPFDGDEAGVAVHGTTTLTLIAIEQTAGGRVARIRTGTEGTIAGTDLGLPREMQAGPAQGRFTGDGEAIWSVDRARLLSMTTRADVTLRQDVTVQGDQVRVALHLAGTSHRELNSVEARGLNGGGQPTNPQNGGASPPTGAGDSTASPDPVHRGRD